MPTLRVLRPDAPEVTYTLVGQRITVGRRADNTIQIVDSSVSARHAELLLAGDHYRLHDLESTNLSFVDGQAVADFHLHGACKLTFGTVPCEFDPGVSGADTKSDAGLTPAQLEKDVVFLRTENQDLLTQIAQQQRQIDILSSARLVTGKAEGAQPDSALLEIKRLREERDAVLYQISGLKLAVEKLREELEITVRERDHARRAHELLQGEKAAVREAPRDGEVVREEDKGTTQRIVFPVPTGGRE